MVRIHEGAPIFLENLDCFAQLDNLCYIQCRNCYCIMSKKTNLGLRRFVRAQKDIYKKVATELSRGKKETHWMWFIFPQIAGLGQSETSQYYAIQSLDEARRYLKHRILGKRLRQCTQLVLAIDDRSARDIFDPPDDQKFHSSMTLFAMASPRSLIFRSALLKFFSGKKDQGTVSLL